MIDEAVAGLMLIAEAAGAVYLFWRNKKKKQTEEIMNQTPEEKSIEQYGFDFCSVSAGMDNAARIRERLETLQQLQTKIDMSRTDLYHENCVIQVQWYDWNQCRYVAYDLPISGACAANGDLMEQVVAAEKARLTASLFGEFEKIRYYGEVKTVDKTERGAGEGSETAECQI